MNFFKRKRNNTENRKGVILVTVVMVMAVSFILLASIVGFVNRNVSQTISNYRKQQAFMTASTYLKSFISDIENKTAISDPDNATEVLARDQFVDKIKALANANGGAGTVTKNVKVDGNDISDYNMGEVEISIKKDGDSADNLVILAKCTYLGEEDQIAARISIPTKKNPATYNNAIEIAGNGSNTLENVNVIGSMQRINSSGVDDATIEYVLKNDNNVYGSYFVYGSVLKEHGSATDFALQKAYVKDSDGNYGGANVTVTRDFRLKGNYVNIYSSMAKEDNCNYLNVGQKLSIENGGKFSVGGNYAIFNGVTVAQYKANPGIIPTNLVDTYCTNFDIGNGANNEYNQHGNLYVKKGADLTTTGNLVIGNDARLKIFGDLYVAGDVSINSTNVYVSGTIYVGGNVDNIAKLQANGNTVITKSASPSDYKDAPETPEIPLTMNEYKYTPEYILSSGDNTATSITDQYKSFYNAPKNTKTLKDFVTSSNITISTNRQDKTHKIVTTQFRAEIDDSFTFDSNAFKTGGNKDDNIANKKYLIHVTNKNILIRLKDVDLDAQYAALFVVKNDSPLDSKGGHKFGCYFVSDSDVGTSVVEAEGVKNMSGMHPANFSMQSFGILDYDTYVNIWGVSDLSSSNFNGSFSLNSDVILNTTDTPSADYASKAVGNEYYFKPNAGNIHVLLTEGSTFNVTNNAFFECEFYCPGADVSIKTTSANCINVCDANGDKIPGGVGILNIGMIVANSVTNQNNNYFVFNQPDPGSFWGPIKGKKGISLVGYKLDKYNYY